MRNTFLLKRILKQILLLTFTFCAYFSVQAESQFITIDQFGYRPDAVKMAVLRDPQTGNDSEESYTPSTTIDVVNAATGEIVYSGTAVQFNNGEVDAASGDMIWWFDFSSIEEEGEYYISDSSNDVKSYNFIIAKDVYNDVLKAAVRMLYYQRCGFEKTAQYAGESWADGASHLGNLQDLNCRLYSAKTDASTERDLHGGWYDAGDYNKYTSWTSDYVTTLLEAYRENPDVWADNYNLPESGNGIPDLLDEIKWGMDWLLRMQEEDGSVLSIVGLSHSCPPSKATGQSLYGPATSNATMGSVRAFALGAIVYNQIGMTDYANQLKTAALAAWNWVINNETVYFHNNTSDNGSTGLGAGDQEGESSAYLPRKLAAATYMYELTQEATYMSAFENNFGKTDFISWGNYMYQYGVSTQFALLNMLLVDGVASDVKEELTDRFASAINSNSDYAAKLDQDGYRSFIKDYNWGSNKYKSDYGLTFYKFADCGINSDMKQKYIEAAEDYIHYIHGVNPFSMVYLTNMSSYGASKSLNEIYHTWFADGTEWDQVSESTAGPAPGFLSGGPNSTFVWDGCCPSTCGSTANNAKCYSLDVPVGLPDAKMYLDFNSNWPLNSWQITEPSCGYQVSYIKLLSKFASPVEKSDVKDVNRTSLALSIYPNPASDEIFIRAEELKSVQIFSLQMQLVKNLELKNAEDEIQMNISDLQSGSYILFVKTERGSYHKKFIKL